MSTPPAQSPDPMAAGGMPPAQAPMGATPTTPPPGSPTPGAQMPPVNQPPVNPQWDALQPKPVSGQDLSSHPPASPAARVGARLLNEVLTILVLFFPFLFAAPFIGYMTEELQAVNGVSGVEDSASIMAVVLIFLVLIPFQLINEIVFVRLFGGNLGKLMMGLRVIDPDTGHFVSIGKALLRYLILHGPWIVAVGISLLVPAYMELINNVVSFGWWLVLLLSFALAPPLFQGFQDRWSNSRVVKKVKQF